MFYFDLFRSPYKKVHFIGIGGVSMSGIAELLHRHGYIITGSDSRDDKYLDHLRRIGLHPTVGQKKDNVQDQDLFVFTDAIPRSNEELKAAYASGKPVVSRGEFLGALMRNFQYAIAVSGSHGKSTTTSMISKILLEAQVDPTILLGGSLDELDGNVRCGNGPYFLAEACEYKENIRFYYPQICIILNIEADHLDYYKDLDDVVRAFGDYIGHLSADSMSLLNFDDPKCREIQTRAAGASMSFSIQAEDADYRATDITIDAQGHPSFQVHFPDGEVLPFQLGVIGRFNIYNALSAIAATDYAHVPRRAIQNALAAFRPLHRRMEYIGEFEEATVLTDYGHHPTEIRSTLSALAEQTKGKLLCVFQPHTYSRTLRMMDEFAHCFDDADFVIVTDIFAAREVDDGSVHATDLIHKLEERQLPCAYCPTFDDVENFLHGRVQSGDCILTTSCGDIDRLAYQLSKKPYIAPEE